MSANVQRMEEDALTIGLLAFARASDDVERRRALRDVFRAGRATERTALEPHLKKSKPPNRWNRPKSEIV